MKKRITAAVLVVSIMCFTGIAFAKVVPIPGAPVFPVKITQPGSYKLTNNLVVPNVNTTAILVQADNVTIDLNGFAILGSNVCTGSAASRTLVCNHNGAGQGIGAGNHKSLKVYNGTIRGMGDDGISTTGDGAIIEGMRVESNGGIGIRVGDHSVVSGNTANNNGESGMLILGGVVSGNTASNNNNQGIALSGGLATGNTADNNEEYGLELQSYVSGYVNNVFFLNGSGPVSGGVNLKPNLCDGALCN